MATGLFGAPRRLPKIDPALGAMLRREQGILPGDQPQIDQKPQMPGMQRKPGLGTRLLGEGWEEKVNALGGLLRGDPNAVGNYQALQQHRADQAAALRQQSLKRDQDWQDWVRKEQYKAQNPGPATPTELSRLYAERDALPPNDPRRAIYDQRIANVANPPLWRQGPDGQFYRVETAQPQVLGSTLPPGWTIQGDGAGNGAGGFPR
jgi:hypothetical protein